MNASMRAGVSERVQRIWNARGPAACALLPLAALFGLLTALRRAAYRHGWLHAVALPVPVVVVGNLVAGGAGKTPTVIAVVALLRRLGYTPGVVSRGHGRQGNEPLSIEPSTAAALAGDEPLLLRRRTGAPVVVARDRVLAGRELLRRFPDVDVLVSDDGLQHLRLARHAQVLVFDERGAGNGWLLPAGPLREPVPVAMPPRTIVLYNAVAPTTALAGSVVQRRLAGVAPLEAWWHGQPASPGALAALAGRPLVAAAGIARPERFFAMLGQSGLNVSALPLPDHHDFQATPWPAQTPDVIVTEKDAVKLLPGETGPTRVWVAALDFELDASFSAALTDLLPPRPSRSTHGNPPA